MKKKDSSPENALGTRERLIATAIRMFGKTGIRATGIDPLLAEAKAAKMSLYGHFKSKEDLIVAVIDEQSDRLLAAFEAAAAEAPTRLGKVAAVFDGVAAKIAADDFHGCEFIRALSEYPDPNSPINQAVVRHRERLRTFLRELVGDATLALSLSILIDGALVDGHATGQSGAAQAAKEIAVALMAAKI
jgi:AcrR family transcriptional regulator